MLNLHLRQYLPERFKHCHKQFLTNKIYNDETMYKDLFADEKVKKAYDSAIEQYFNSIYTYYTIYPKGDYSNQYYFIQNNADLMLSVREYEALTNDKTFFGFLQIYGYCVEQLNAKSTNSNGEFDLNGAKSIFDISEKTSIEMYDMVKKDIEIKNYW